jgi:hypothetical protein
VFTDPKTGVLYVYYGQERYTSLLNALQYLPTDPFTEGDTFDFTTFVGFLVLKGNASDITDTAANSIINGGLFRGSGQGSGGGIALSNLDDLTDVTIVNPTNGQALIYDAGIWKNGTPLSASYAVTASYIQNAQTASYVLQAVSSSFASTASFVTASNVIGTVVSASYALTASFLVGGITIDTGSLVTTASFNAFTSSYTTGSFTGSFTGDGSGLTGVGAAEYIRRSDYTGSVDPNVNLLYLGQAISGSSESANVWDISRLSISSSGETLTQTTSSGAWTGRYSYVYL